MLETFFWENHMIFGAFSELRKMVGECGVKTENITHIINMYFSEIL